MHENIEIIIVFLLISSVKVCFLQKGQWQIVKQDNFEIMMYYVLYSKVDSFSEVFQLHAQKIYFFI